MEFVVTEMAFETLSLQTIMLTFSILKVLKHSGCLNIVYRIYSCISRPFMTKKSAQKIALDLYTSHTQRPDQAVREISITTA